MSSSKQVAISNAGFINYELSFHTIRQTCVQRCKFEPNSTLSFQHCLVY